MDVKELIRLPIRVRQCARKYGKCTRRFRQTALFFRVRLTGWHFSHRRSSLPGRRRRGFATRRDRSRRPWRECLFRPATARGGKSGFGYGNVIDWTSTSRSLPACPRLDAHGWRPGQ